MLEMGAHSPLKNLPSHEREALEIRADRAYTRHKSLNDIK